jgi:hypothetical protein
LGRALNLIESSPLSECLFNECGTVRTSERLVSILPAFSSRLFPWLSTPSLVKGVLPGRQCVGLLSSCHFHSWYSCRLGRKRLEREPRWIYGRNTIEHTTVFITTTLVVPLPKRFTYAHTVRIRRYTVQCPVIWYYCYYCIY